MTLTASNQLFDAYFTAREMRGVFCDQGRVQAMLDFEAALARAQARVGVIPASAVAPIEAACHAGLYDFQMLGEAIATAGNSAIPLVKALGRQIARSDGEAERFVHLGATSQDVMDSGLVLQLRRAMLLLEQDLERLGDILVAQAQRYATTPMAGRTWLQHATPVTLGMKIGGWLGALTRSRERLQQLKPRLLVLQFGGASGTLAALGEQALPIAQALADELQLALPEQPWHTQRDRLVEFASVLGLLAGSLGKLGRDISLLMQTEAAEVFEPSAPGKGRVVHHAAQAQPGGRGGADQRRDPGSRPAGDDVCRHAPGARAQPGPVARRMGNPAGDLLPGVWRVATSITGGRRPGGRQRAHGAQPRPDPGPGAGRSGEHCPGPAPGAGNRPPFAGTMLQARSGRETPSAWGIGGGFPGYRRAVGGGPGSSIGPGALPGPGAGLGRARRG